MSIHSLCSRTCYSIAGFVDTAFRVCVSVAGLLHDVAVKVALVAALNSQLKLDETGSSLIATHSDVLKTFLCSGLAPCWRSCPCWKPTSPPTLSVGHLAQAYNAHLK